MLKPLPTTNINNYVATQDIYRSLYPLHSQTALETSHSQPGDTYRLGMQSVTASRKFVPNPAGNWKLSQKQFAISLWDVCPAHISHRKHFALSTSILDICEPGLYRPLGFGGAIPGVWGCSARLANWIVAATRGKARECSGPAEVHVQRSKRWQSNVHHPVMIPRGNLVVSISSGGGNRTSSSTEQTLCLVISYTLNTYLHNRTRKPSNQSQAKPSQPPFHRSMFLRQSQTSADVSHRGCTARLLHETLWENVTHLFIFG